MIIFNIVQNYAGFRNNYILDLIDDTTLLLNQNPQNILLVHKKEKSRIQDKEESDRILYFWDHPSSYEDMGSFYNRYDYAECDSYYGFPHKDYETKEIQDSINNSFTGFREIRHYKTGKGHGVYSFFHHPPIQPYLIHIKETTEPAEIREILTSGTLKDYNPEYDTYVVLFQDKLYWIFGSDTPIGTEALYLIYTDQLELLPEHRKKYGYDNRGVRIRSLKDTKQIGKYNVVAVDIPHEYSIVKIKVGLRSRQNKVLWSRTIRIKSPKKEA